MKRNRTWFAVAGVLPVASVLTLAATRPKNPTPPGAQARQHLAPEVAPGLLVRRKPDTSSLQVAQILAAPRPIAVRQFRHPAGLYFVLPAEGQQSALAFRLRASGLFQYVEPNYVVHAAQAQRTPDDTNFGEQWALQAGGAGLDMPTLWGILGTGDKNTVVAVIDSGLDCDHGDLKANLWKNPRETVDGKDDDGNDYVDDIMGINTLEPSKPPCGDNGHGTFVAGIIAAVGNNGDAGIDNGTGFKSISGVVWNASILSCKFMAIDSGELAKAIECLAYVAALKDAHPDLEIVATNNSWGDLVEYSQALEDAIAAQRNLGILFVTAAGNCTPGSDDCNLDRNPRYPASSPLSNVITVAAVDKGGNILSTSKRGRRSVHVAAPGDAILTTAPNNLFQLLSSTSMAAPQVTGLLALLAQGSPPPDWRVLRNLILTSGPGNGALQQATISGRRIGGAGFSAKSCGTPTLQARVSPLANQGTETLPNGATAVHLAALHLNCTQPAGEVDVAIHPPSGPDWTLALKDLGNGVADDGVYADNWTPPGPGLYKLTMFPGSAMKDKFSVIVP